MGGWYGCGGRAWSMWRGSGMRDMQFRAGVSNSFSPGATSASQLPSKGRNNFRTV